MKRILLLVLTLLNSLALYGSDIDLCVSKGTGQEVVRHLSPSPSQTDVWNNAKIEVSLNLPLDPSSVQKNNIKLTYLSSRTNEHISGKLAYIETGNQVVFTPDSTLDEGVYEVEIKSLKSVKGNNTHIDEIKYRFYVPKVLNGYQLPPEPDEKLNNSTLLGIDYNNNGVRDDVERYIIKRYAEDPKYPKIKTAIALQYAWASQKVLENPTMESKKYIDDALDCQYYWADKETEKYTRGLSGFEKGKYYRKLKLLNDPVLKDKIYNTRARINQKFTFNAALSGNIFDGRSESIDNCRINIDELGE